MQSSPPAPAHLVVLVLLSLDGSHLAIPGPLPPWPLASRSLLLSRFLHSPCTGVRSGSGPALRLQLVLGAGGAPGWALGNSDGRVLQVGALEAEEE